MEARTKLRYYREKAGKTQQQMADSLNIHKSTYCLIEQGKRGLTIERAKKISEILGRPISKIF